MFVNHHETRDLCQMPVQPAWCGERVRGFCGARPGLWDCSLPQVAQIVCLVCSVLTQHPSAKDSAQDRACGGVHVNHGLAEMGVCPYETKSWIPSGKR